MKKMKGKTGGGVLAADIMEEDGDTDVGEIYHV